MGCCAKKQMDVEEQENGSTGSQDRLEKKYLLDSKVLGSGSYAKVYRARENKTGKVVAVKRIDKAHSRRELLDAEIMIMQRFSRHKNIVGLFGVYETEEEVQLVIEFMAGGELFDALDSNGPYTEECAARHLRDIASALEYLHGNRVAHRDLKPENLLLSSKPPGVSTLKLSDFGLAAILQEKELFSMACGTWAYCAPEVLRVKNQKTGAYDWRCDLWSVGVLLFVILAAYHPFDVDGTNTDKMMQELIAKGEWDFEDVAWDEVSDSAKDLIKALLEPDVDKRLSATQVLQHNWTSSLCKYGSLSLKINSDLKCYSLRMKQKALKAVMNEVKAVKRIEHLTIIHKIEDQKHRRAQELWLLVKEAIKNRRLWQDSNYPKSAALKLTHNRFLRLQNSPDIADVYRQERIARVFKHLDRDENGWLTRKELYPFAQHTDLARDETEWKEEFRKLCKECGWDKKLGINLATFQLVVSTKEFYFYCSNTMLRHLLKQLEGGAERGASVGRLAIDVDDGESADSSPIVRLRSEPAVTRTKTGKSSSSKKTTTTTSVKHTKSRQSRPKKVDPNGRTLKPNSPLDTGGNSPSHRDRASGGNSSILPAHRLSKGSQESAGMSMSAALVGNRLDPVAKSREPSPGRHDPQASPRGGSTNSSKRPTQSASRAKKKH